MRVKSFIISLMRGGILLALLSTAYAEADQKNPQCDFGYVRKGAIAMYGLPDIETTNRELCKLYHAYPTNTPTQQSLHIAQRESFSGINYLISKGDVSYSVRPWLVESLMFRSPFEPFTMYPHIAAIEHINASRSFAIFKVDPRARFSNGQRITAKDVLFSFETLKKYGRYNYQIAYKNITAKLLSASHIRFNFTGHNRELPLLLGLMPVFSKDTSLRQFQQQSMSVPMMASPYKVTSYEIGKSIELEKDPNYWGLETPQGKARFHFQRVKFDFYQSETASFESLRAGQSDFFYEDNLKRMYTAYDFPAIKNGDYVIHKVPTLRPAGMMSFTLNTRRPFLNDKTIRQAMFLAFNFDAVNKDYLYGAFEQSNSLFAKSDLAHDVNGYHAPQEAFAKDHRERLRYAHKLLREAGYSFKKGALHTQDGHKVMLNLLLSNPDHEKYAGALKSDLEKIGIELSLQTVDASLYQHYLNDFNFDMIVYGWYNSMSPGIEQKNYWHSQSASQAGSRNYAGINDPEIDQAIQDLINAQDRAALRKATSKLDFMLMQGFYFIPLYGQNHYVIVTRKDIVPSVGGATYFVQKRQD